jgi:hypothetical protein
MILGGKRAGHVARRSDYAVGDKPSFWTYLERGEGILVGVGPSYLLNIVTSWFKTM